MPPPPRIGLIDVRKSGWGAGANSAGPGDSTIMSVCTENCCYTRSAHWNIELLQPHQTSTKKASPIEKFKKIPLFKCKLQMKNCKQHCIMAGSKNLPNLPTDSSSKKLLMVGGVGVKNRENFADSLNRWSLEIWPLLQLLKVS